MTERHLISIIIPVYNVAEYLCECLDSVLAQSYRNLEIILVDDGSTDNSGDICDKYAEKDSRITVIHRENGGPSAARNAALDMMHGQYVTFIDSDDTIHPQYIKLLYDNSCRFNADISSAALTTNRGKICDNFPKGHSRLFSSTDAVKHILYQHIWTMRFPGNYIILHCGTMSDSKPPFITKTLRYSIIYISRLKPLYTLIPRYIIIDREPQAVWATSRSNVLMCLTLLIISKLI